MVIKRVGSVLFVAPMTTRGKESRYYYSLPEHYFGKASRIILSQAKHIDAKRLTYKLGTIGREDFSQIKKKLRDLIL